MASCESARYWRTTGMLSYARRGSLSLVTCARCDGSHEAQCAGNREASHLLTCDAPDIALR